jgi:hypothetical protein
MYAIEESKLFFLGRINGYEGVPCGSAEKRAIENIKKRYMNNLSFRGLRMGQPHYVAEFNWPVGKEIPLDVRRLTVNEFYLAIQLAARSVREMKEPRATDEYKEKYEELIERLHDIVVKKDSTIREYIDSQIDEVTAEISAIQGLLAEELQPAVPLLEAAVVEQPKRKVGRPKKVMF